MSSSKMQYRLGNAFGGYFTGEYHTVMEAWKDLCEWFDSRLKKSIPRRVFLYVKEINKYGHEQFLICRVGTTPGKVSKKTIINPHNINLINKTRGILVEEAEITNKYCISVF